MLQKTDGQEDNFDADMMGCPWSSNLWWSTRDEEIFSSAHTWEAEEGKDLLRDLVSQVIHVGAALNGADRIDKADLLHNVYDLILKRPRKETFVLTFQTIVVA